MPDKVFAVVVAGVVEEPPLPPHMFQRCQQPTNKDMGAAGVDADAAEADSRTSNTPLAVSPDPGHGRCVSPDLRDAPTRRWWRQYVQPCPSRRHARICPSRWHAAAGAAALLQCRQTLRELECMLHVRLRRTRWPHQRDMPGPTQSGPRRLLHTSKRATIY